MRTVALAAREVTAIRRGLSSADAEEAIVEAELAAIERVMVESPPTYTPNFSRPRSPQHGGWPGEDRVR
jgi:hypothetical protein